jgi:hypothetical protein
MNNKDNIVFELDESQLDILTFVLILRQLGKSLQIENFPSLPEGELPSDPKEFENFLTDWLKELFQRDDMQVIFEAWMETLKLERDGTPKIYE